VAQVRVLILRSPGINCDLETERAWELAGASATRVHIGRLIEQPNTVNDYQVMTIPGGFSYGDDIAAGRILAAQVKRHLLGQVQALIDADKLVLGICNGFQTLVQIGVLPARTDGQQPRRCTIAGNEPPGFQDRWVYLRAPAGKCVFLEQGKTYEMPIAHGEGRVAFTDPADYEALVRNGQDALVYAGPPDGQSDLHGQPANPNGSTGDIAGLCDDTGRVLGLMPHPERFVTWTQHPCWTAQPEREEGDGLALFRRAVAYFA
jgi:phosphoribosylformylglycinamidine synthase